MYDKVKDGSNYLIDLLTSRKRNPREKKNTYSLVILGNEVPEGY